MKQWRTQLIAFLEWTASICGLLITAIGINVMYRANLGAAPIEALNQLIALKSHIAVGTVSQLTAIIFVFLVALVTRSPVKYLGLAGGIISGYFINVTAPYVMQLLPAYNAFITQLLILLGGSFLMSFGSLMTIQSKRLIGFNDAVLVQLYQSYFKDASLSLVKIGYDCSLLLLVVVLGLLSGINTIGIGTVVMMVAVGGNIQWIRSVEMHLEREVLIEQQRMLRRVKGRKK